MVIRNWDGWLNYTLVLEVRHSGWPDADWLDALAQINT
jgi:hypothetical protein